MEFLTLAQYVCVSVHLNVVQSYLKTYGFCCKSGRKLMYFVVISTCKCASFAFILHAFIFIVFYRLSIIAPFTYPSSLPPYALSHLFRLPFLLASTQSRICASNASPRAFTQFLRFVTCAGSIFHFFFQCMRFAWKSPLHPRRTPKRKKTPKRTNELAQNW